jgi:1-acyl-sn-glycerol-3-phosphate acyltransferase
MSMILKMRVLLSFILLSIFKIMSLILYKFEIQWLNTKPTWKKVRMIVFLNHTSLYEPLYIGFVPFPFLWRLSRKMVAPGADKTLNRPIVGLIWKLMGPGIYSISRKRDKTWRKFMEAVHNRSVIVIAAEGRMKRPNGLDLNGRPMTVRSGVADILEHLSDGNILVAYSGGLHHVQKPGQTKPNFFKTLKMNVEVLDIDTYKSQFNTEGIQWKKDVVKDMQHRLENNCPVADDTPIIKASEQTA